MNDDVALERVLVDKRIRVTIAKMKLRLAQDRLALLVLAAVVAQDDADEAKRRGDLR